MKSKIGKLNKDWLQIQPEHRDLYRKVDEIIDHLNSQPEENNFVHTVGTPMLEGTTTCSQDTPEKELTEESIWQIKSRLFGRGI